MLGIAALEGLALVAGVSAAGWLDSILTHDHPEIAQGHVDSVLGWLHVGRVPMLALVVILLAAFALIGFTINMVVHGLFGFYPPIFLGAPVAFLASVPVLRISGKALSKVMPRDESTAVSLDSLVGRIATVIGGTARVGFPAQAKVSTEHGQALYVMVEPDADDTTFGANDPVLLVKRLSGTRFQGIRNPKPDLL
jgi:hypothetical protein